MAEAAQDHQPERSMSELAAQKFGRNFHGEAAPAPEPAAEPVEAEEQINADGQPEGLQEEAHEQEAAQQEQAEEEQQVIESLSELIEAQEWDPEWVNALRVPVKVNGSEGEATLEDLVRSYQTQEAASQKLEQAKERDKQLRELEAQQRQKWEQSIAVSSSILQEQLNGIEQRMNDPQLAKLRQDDPAEWGARMREIETQKADTIRKIQGLAQNVQQIKAQQEQKTQAEHQERLQSEQAALLEKLPAWRNAETAKAEQAQLVDYLIGRGFSQEEAMGASDHRLILLARDAMLYRQGQQSADAASKKVAKVPKVLKPGAPKSPDQKSREQQTQLRRQVRKAKSSQQAVGAAFELMKAKRPNK